MLSRLLRQALFILVHFIVNVLVAVQNVYQQLFSNTKHLSKSKVIAEDFEVLLENLPNLKKKIKHLVVLADTNCHTTPDLSRLVIWSLIIGVPYISFHDISGKLKENDEKLFFEVQKHKKGIPGCIKWFNKPNLNGYTNGNHANTIVINIFTHSDGKQKIAQCIKKIAIDPSVDKKTSDEFTAEEFNQYLSLEYPSIPDPDIVLYTGPLCCTYGVLPWQIRLTEFIQLSLGHTINMDNFLGALYKYNKCDQRFGK